MRRRAVNLRRDAELRQRDAGVQLAAADPGRALSIGKAHRSFPFSDVMQFSVGAAAGGLFIAVGYLFAREVWDGVRRRARRGPDVAPATG